MDVVMVEYARITDESADLDALRYALCARWLRVIEEVLHPDAPKLIQLLTDHVMGNIDHWMDTAEVDQTMIGHIGRLLLGWPKLIHQSFVDLENDQARNELLLFLIADCWPLPFSDQQLLEFAEEIEKLQLSVANAAAEIEQQPQQQASAVANDVEPDHEAELILAFRDELLSSCRELGSAAELIALPDGSPDILFHFRDAWQDLLAGTAEMTKIAQFKELEYCCDKFAGYLQAMKISQPDFAQTWAERLDGWSMLFGEVLANFNPPVNCDLSDLRGFIDDEEIWDDALTTASDDMQTPSASTPEPVQVSILDVMLKPDHDVHPAVLSEFLLEAEDHTVAFTAIVQHIVIGNADRHTLETAQRIAHTLKGAANTTGYRGIANLSHHVEDMLEYLYQHEVTPPQSILALLVEVSDCLEVMIEHIQGRSEEPENALELLQQLVHWHHCMVHDVPANMTADSITLPFPPTASPVAEKEKSAELKTVPAEEELEQAPKETQETLRVPRDVIDYLLRQVGEITIAMGQMRNRFDQLKLQLHSHSAMEKRTYDNGLELDALLSAKGMGLINAGGGTAARDMSAQPWRDEDAGSTAVGDNVDVFDPLEMDQYNELHSGVNRLLESISDGQTVSEGINQEIEELDSLLLNQKRLHRFLQEKILQTRMAPFLSLEMRLQRIARQTARKTGKKVQLLCSGMELMVDSEVLNKIADPLMHILRNAIDHGIETPEQRELAGKESLGTVRLSISQLGHDVRIRCQDDGRGLDFEAIRRSAEAKQLIDPQQTLSQEELARLTLQPGFSTRSEATQISGRGFGMDIVLQTVSRLKGRLQLIPIESGGLLIEIHIPVTLVTIHALLIESQQQVHAIPTRDIIRVLNRGEGSLKTLGNSVAFVFEEKVYPVFWLNALLWGNNEAPDQTTLQQSIPLIIRGDEKLQVVLVENTLECQELIMKNAGRYLPQIHGVSGASILNDSHIATVLNLPELSQNRGGGSQLKRGMTPDKKRYIEEKSAEPTVMIVDDSLSIRRTLSALMQDIGYKTMLAIDGIEAISMLEEQMPDIMLLDLELPRMNGLELSSYLRKQAATKDLPIIMITSRATMKHRERAQKSGINHYMVKPFQEDDLLQHIERLLGKQSS